MSVWLVLLTIAVTGLGGVGWGAFWGVRLLADQPSTGDRVRQGMVELERLHEVALSEIVAPVGVLSSSIASSKEE